MGHEFEEISGNKQTDFLAYFSLKSKTTDEIPKRNNSVLERSLSPKKKKKRPNQRARQVTKKKEKDLEQLIPFSSPVGIVLTRKDVIDDGYKTECLKYTEECCHDTKVHLRSRKQWQIVPETAVIQEMRKPRHYYRPKRTLCSLSREANFEFLNRPLIESTRSCSVNLYKCSAEEIRWYQERMKKNVECVDLVSDSDDDSIIAQDEVDVQASDQGGFPSSLCEESVHKMMPLSLVSAFSFTSPAIPVNLDHFSPYPNESSSSPRNFHQIAFSTSTTTSNMSSGKRERENDDPEKHMEKRSIQNWIQNVNGEKFKFVEQGTVMNSN